MVIQSGTILTTCRRVGLKSLEVLWSMTEILFPKDLKTVLSRVVGCR